MVRMRILQNLTLACALAFTGAAIADSDGEVYPAKVVSDYQLQFPPLGGLLARGKYKTSVDLEIVFKKNVQFSADQVTLTLNGLMCNADLTQLKAASHWEHRDEGLSVLVIEVDRLRFGNQESFRDKIESIYLYNGAAVLTVRAPEKIKSARLHFFEPSRNPPPPVVSLDSVSPAGPVVRVPSIEFKFSSLTTNRFECRHVNDDGAWEPCASPKTYSNLQNGEHRFRFRAIDVYGRHGRSVRYVVQVAAPRPAVEITKVEPPENPTTSTSIAIYFEKKGHHSIQCRLDAGTWARCKSPFRASNLVDGEHSAAFRAPSWIYDFAWGKYLSRYKWFQTLCPGFTEPVVYTWRVASAQMPTVQIVSGPSQITNSTAARFEFRSAQTSTFRCSLDGNAQVACSSPWEYSGLAEGLHEFSVTPHVGALNGDAAVYRWTVDRTRPVLTLGAVAPSNSPTSSRTLSLSFTVSEPAATSCSLDGGAAQACVSPVQVVSLSEGAHRLSVTAVDNAGNVSDALVYDWVVDTTPPDVTVHMTSPASSPTHSTSATFSITSAGAASFQCSLDGSPAQACTSPLTVSGLADGRHELVVVATDAAGNHSAPGSVQWDVDTVAPVVHLGAAIPPESPTTSRTLELPFDVSETASVTCELDFGGQVPCRTPFSAAGLADGDHRVEILAVDGAGNVSAAARYLWSVRTVAVVQILGVSPAGSAVASTSMTITFGSPTAVSFQCALDGAAFAACTSPASVSGLADGAHHFAIRGLNVYGEIGPTVAHDWTVDTTGPVVVLGAIVPSENPTANPTRSIAFSAPDAVSFECKLDGGAAAACTSPRSVTVGEGSHTLSIVGIDALGNRGSAVSYTWSVDMTGPVLTLGAFSPTAAASNQTSFSASFTANETATFLCSLDGAAEAACTSPFTGTVRDGNHTVSIVGIDTVGNRGAAITHSWTVDATPPVVTIGTFAPATSPTSSASYSASFTANKTSTFFCSLDGAAEAACTSPATGTVTDGNHTFSVTAVDAVGNRSAAVTRAWSVDATPPVLTIGAVLPATSPSSSASYSIAFSANEPSTFRCSLDGAAESVCTSPAAGTVSDGTHSMSIVAVDTVGNRSAAYSRSWTVDTTPPVVTFGAFLPATSPTSSVNYSVSFAANETSTFFCSLDGAAESACTSPVSGTVLDGNHTFSVTAVDTVGNRGATISRSWTVDSTGPVITIGAFSPTGTTSSQLTFSAAFTANEPASFFCSLDGAAEAACTSPFTGSVGEGSHTVSIAGVDALGNRGAAATRSWTVSVPAAVASIGSFAPSVSPTASNAASASFTGTNAVSFVCSLDGAAFSACTSPVSYSGLADGSHTFSVAGVNAVGLRGPSASRTWTVDTTPPVVTVGTFSPSTSPTSQLTYSASFTANETATFFCSLDGAAEAACTSPVSGSVGQGNHTFSVTGVDLVGNRGATVTRSWTVNVPSATASITSQSPTASPTNVTSRTFNFTGTDASSFQCSLDGLSYVTCASPVSYTGLVEGSHSFSVRGVNALGVSGTPATATWVVDTTPPTVTIVSTTPGWTPTSQTTLTATFSTSEPASTFCQLDAGAVVSCTSPYSVTVGNGSHSLSIYAVDLAGNQGPWTNYTWTVDTSALTISSLSVSSITSNSAQLAWTTNLAANSRVKYGTTPDMPLTTTVDPAYVTSHGVSLTGLSPFTFYYVQAVSVDRDGREVSSNVVTFRTLH